MVSTSCGSVPDQYSYRFHSPSPSGSPVAPLSPVASNGSSPYSNSHPSGSPSPSESLSGAYAYVPVRFVCAAGDTVMFTLPGRSHAAMSLNDTVYRPGASCTTSPLL